MFTKFFTSVITILLLTGGAAAQPFPISEAERKLNAAIDAVEFAAIEAHRWRERLEAAEAEVDRIEAEKTGALDQMRFDNAILKQVDVVTVDMQADVERLQSNILEHAALMFAAEAELAEASDTLREAQQGFTRRQTHKEREREVLLGIVREAVAEEQAAADERTASMMMQLGDTRAALSFAAQDLLDVCTDGRAEADPLLCDPFEDTGVNLQDVQEFYFGLVGASAPTN